MRKADSNVHFQRPLAVCRFMNIEMTKCDFIDEQRTYTTGI